MRLWLCRAAVMLLLVAGAVTEVWSRTESLWFGVIIHRSPTLTAEVWNPILRYISARSGVPLQLKVAKTGPEHTAMVGRGELHFLYSNHNFITDNEASGYRVFARPKGDAGRGEIVVLKDSPFQSLADLKGQEVVFPHTAAFLGYHLPMDALLRQGVEVTPLFAGNQEGAMAQLKARRATAAGVSAEVMRGFAEREHMQYRVLWSSEPYLNLALSAHPSVPAAKVKAVQEAFLGMTDDAEGARVLAAAGDLVKQPMPSAFVRAKDSDFDNMRKFYRTTKVKVELQ
jgi:phosphonate transport system substrate-binding protein